MRGHSDFQSVVAWVFVPNPQLRVELEHRLARAKNDGEREACLQANAVAVRFVQFIANRPLLESEFKRIEDMWRIWFDIPLLDHLARMYSIRFGLCQDQQSGFVMLGAGDLGKLERLEVTSIFQMCTEALNRLEPVEHI